MSTTIDSKVVEMRFDNGQFEKNVQTSLSTLDKLKQSLNFNGISDFAKDISSKAKNVNLSPIGEAVETVKVKFSMLEVAVATVFANMVNSAVNAGKRIVKALTVDPIYTGYQEYNEKMNSVQTIMAGTGEDLETVMRYLEELNLYADKTIYSFADMTRNIGKFTNAGVKLEDAVLAIQGISNEAAVSGANANEASRAMYNFAQALSAGYVKLIDWKSIENANMATVEFKNQLLETAVAVGTVTKDAKGMYTVLTENNQGRTMKDTINATHNFNESLAYQWMTTEVLVKTLRKYSDSTTDIGKKAFAAAQDIKTFKQLFDTLTEAAQSGWAVTWELIIGDFDEAKETLTEIGKIFSGILDKISDTRNSFVKGALTDSWKQLRDEVRETGIDTDKFQNSLISTAKKHGVAIDDLIKKYGSFEKSLEDGWMTADIFSESLSGYVDSASKVTMSTKEMNEKLSAFQMTVKDIWKSDFFTLDEKIQQLADAGYNYADVQDLITLTLDDQKIKIEDLTQAQKEALGFTKGHANEIKNLAEEAKKAGTPISDLINRLEKPSGRELVIDSLRNALRGLIDIAKAVTSAFSEIFPKPTADQVYNIVKSINEFSKKLRVSEETADKVKRTFKGLFAVLDLIGSIIKGVVTTAFNIFGVRVTKLSDGILTLTAKIGDAIVKFRDWVKEHDHIESFFKGVGVVIGKFIEVLKSLKDRLTESEMFQSFVNGLKKLKDSALENIIKMFSKAGDSIGSFLDKLKLFTQLSGEDLLGVFENYIHEIGEKFKGLDGILDTVKDKFSSFFRGTKVDANDSAAGVAGAVAKLDKNVRTYGDKSISIFEKIGNTFDNATSKMRNARIDIRNFFDEFANKISGTQDLADRAVQVVSVIFGFSLISALNRFSKAMNNTVVGAFKGVFTSLSGVFNTFKGVLVDVQKQIRAKKLQSIAKALLAFASALVILVGAIYLISKINERGDIWKSVAVLGALAGGLTVMVGALILISGNKKLTNDMKGLSITLISFSAAVLILVEALREVDKLNTDKLGKDLLVLGGLALGLSMLVTAMSHEINITGVKAAIASAVEMLAFVGSLYLLVELLVKIDETEFEHPIKTIAVFAGIILSLKALTNSMGKIKNTSGVITFLGIVISLKLLISALEDIAKFDADAVLKNTKGLALILGAIAALMLSSKLAGKNAAKGGAAILLISFAMKNLVTVIKRLEEIDESSIKKGEKTVAAFAGIFAALIAISKLSGSESMKAGAMLIMASAAMLILTNVVKAFGDMDADKLKRGTIAVAVLESIFAAMIGLSKLASQVKTGPFVAMAVAIGLLSASIIALSLLKDPEGIKTATACISAVMGMFALMIAMTKFAGETKKVMAVLTALTVITGLLAGLIYGLLVLTEDAQSGKLIETAGSISVLILALSASMRILSKANKLDKGVIANLYAMTGVLAIIGLVVTGLNYISKGPFPIETAISMGILLDALAASMRIMKGLNGVTLNSSIMGTMAIMGLILGEIAIIVGKLGSMNNGQGIKMSIGTTTAMSELLLALSASMWILGGLDNVRLSGSVMSTMGIMAGILGEIAVIVGILGSLNGGQGVSMSIGTATAMSELLIALSTSMWILGGLNNVYLNGSIMSTMGIMAAILGEIAVIVGVLGSLNDGQGVSMSIETATAMSELLIALSISMNILSGMGTMTLNSGVIATIAVMALALGEVAGVVILLNKVGAMELPIETAASMSLLLIALAVVCDILAPLGGLAGAAVAGAAALDGVVVVIGGLIAGLGAINKDGKLEELLNHGIPVLIKVADGLGGFIGHLIGSVFTGAVEAFISKLPTFSMYLSNFAIGLHPFMTILSNANMKSALDSVKDLGSVLVYMGSATFKNALTALFTNKDPLTYFSESADSIANAMVSFSNIISEGNFDVSKANAAAECAKAIAALLTALPKEGGVLDDIFGTSDLSKFGDGLTEIGNGIKDFATCINDANINIEQFRNAANAAQLIADLEAGLTKHGGVYSFLMGDTDISAFGEHLKLFGTKLCEFADTIAGNKNINPELFQKVADSATPLSDLDANLKPHGGLLQKATGDADIKTFGANLKQFGTDIAAFSKSINGEGVVIDPAKFKNVADAAGHLADLEKNLAPTEGIASWFKSTQDIANFGTNLVSFGASLATFSTEISGINSTKIQAVGDATYLLSVAFATLDEAGISFLNTTLATFGTKLVDFGSSFSAYATSVATVNTEKVASVTAEIKNIAAALSAINAVDPAVIDSFAKGVGSLAQMKIDDFMKPFAEAKTKVAQAATDIINAFLSALKSNEANFVTAGQTLVSKLSIGVEGQSNSLNTKMGTILSSAIKAISDKYKDFESAGKTAMTKFIGGIKEQSKNVKDASTAIANDAVPVPSNANAYYNAGTQVVNGFVNGINSGTKSGSAAAYNAGYKLAQDAVQGINDGAKIQSPSKEAMKSGRYIGQGLIIGIDNYGKLVENAGVNLGKSAIDGLKDAVSRISDVIENDIDAQPHIRPVLDLSDVNANVKKLNATFSGIRASRISASINDARSNDLQNGNLENASSGNTYSFVQNNYSPKALSRAEIYRQTKNQFSMLKGRTKA